MRSSARQADAEDRVVVTKDADFRDSHLITGSPRRLLIVATGNITNAVLLELFELHLDTVVAAFTEVFSPRSAGVAVLEMGQDESGAGDLPDSGGAQGDVLQCAPAPDQQGEAAFAEAA